jgi:hypothetical protein
MPDVSIELQSRRKDRAEAVQKLQHVVPAVALLLAGLQSLLAGAEGIELAIAAAEVVTAVLIVGSFARKLRAMRAPPRGPSHHPHAHGVDWIDIFVSAMLAVEVWEHWHATGHIRRPTVLLSATMLAMGLLHGRIMAAAARRSALRVTDAGVKIGFSRFRSFSASWPEIARIDVSDASASVVLTSGRTRQINLADLRNAAAVREALKAAARRLPHEAPSTSHPAPSTKAPST